MLDSLRKSSSTLTCHSTSKTPVENTLRIGGRGGNSLIGDVALVALITGKVDPRQRCELERFVIQQLAAADMAAAAELPDCSAL
jgi:hypothetical protein